MFSPFFALAAQSPSRQQTLRRVVILHLVVLLAILFAMTRMTPAAGRQALGSVLLVAGIVEGAMLVGWRLSQLPKSQALEFLLVSPLRPARVLFAEAAVGLTLLAFVTLSAAPVLTAMAATGFIDPFDLVPLLVLPFTWGAITGVGLTVWSYEAIGVRKVGERVVMALILLYLIVGVLAGENLRHWVQQLPDGAGRAVLRGFAAFHTHNPFGVMKHWMESNVGLAFDRLAGLQLAALAILLVLLARAAWRLQPHFHDLHYQPASGGVHLRRPGIGDHPLTWWAVKRVSRYSGKINLYLAGGFGVLYAIYTVAGDQWPAWLGRRVFELADGAGGIPGLATGLVLLAAVPAAFQYGLWDSTVQDRCRRLELLLLTGLRPRDYWTAAATAAWQRGRGYFAVALLLWAAALIGGRMALGQVLIALSAGVLLWGLYFALGFRAFTRGRESNGLGSLLTIGLPLGVWLLYRLGWPTLGALLPPGIVFSSAAPPSIFWLAGPVLCATLTLIVARHALLHSDRALRLWYDENVGKKVML